MKKEKSKNKNNNIITKKKTEKTNLNNIKPFLLKDLNNENCTTNNKKIKYINLIEKYKGKNKPPNSLMKTASSGFNKQNKKMKGHYSMKNIIHKPHNLRVSSSISSYHGYVPGNNINNNAIKEKTGTSYYKVTKSKSTENFLVFNTNKNYPKTPKEQYRQKLVINNKKIINFMDNFNLTKTSNNKNNNYTKNNFGGIFKGKKNNKTKKK